MVFLLLGHGFVLPPLSSVLCMASFIFGRWFIMPFWGFDTVLECKK